MKHDETLALAARGFDLSPSGIVITDGAGTIRLANAAFAAITGYALEEVRGHNPRLLQSGLQDARFYEEMWCRLRAAGAWEGEIWNRRKSGELYLEWLSIRACPGEAAGERGYIGTFTDVTAHKRDEAELRRLAFFDRLTGLPNRELLTDRLESALLAANREASRVALLFIDLDGFKAVNDSFGHAIGDLTLRRIAECLRMSVRRSDTVARVGGDEFVAVLRDIGSAANAGRVARTILRSLEAGFVIEGHEIRVGASIGISSYPADATSGGELLVLADEAMYAVKRRRRRGGGTGRAGQARARSPSH